MDLVVDANILFAVLIKSGKTEDIMFRHDVRLFTPEFMFEEFAEYRDFLVRKTGRSREEFDLVLAILGKRVRPIPNKESAASMEEARSITPDIKDIEYLALAIRLGCGIWSNDKTLKHQGRVPVYDTGELLKLFNVA